MSLFGERQIEAAARSLARRQGVPDYEWTPFDSTVGDATAMLENAVAALDRDQLIERLANHFDAQGVPALGVPDLENLARSSLFVLGLIEKSP